jgi:hypothetical protein
MMCPDYCRDRLFLDRLQHKRSPRQITIATLRLHGGERLDLSVRTLPARRLIAWLIASILSIAAPSVAHSAAGSITEFKGIRLSTSDDTNLVTTETHDPVVFRLSTGHLTSGPSRTIMHYEVRTPNAIAVTVNGAEFETVYIADRSCPDSPACLRYTDVRVHKGTVRVSNQTNSRGTPVEVSEGYETAVPCDLAPTPPAPMGMRELGRPYH